MPYDRPHDLTVSLYSTMLPFGMNMGLNAYYQSGFPYTGVLFDGGDPANEPKLDYLNKYEFFGRLADSASKYMESVDDGIGNREVLLLAVHNEAEIILKEMLSTIPHIEN